MIADSIINRNFEAAKTVVEVVASEVCKLAAQARALQDTCSFFNVGDAETAARLEPVKPLHEKPEPAEASAPAGNDLVDGDFEEF